MMLVFAVAFGLISLFLAHFVVPIMYLRRISVMTAWSLFRHEFLDGHVGFL